LFALPLGSAIARNFVVGIERFLLTADPWQAFVYRHEADARRTVPDAQRPAISSCGPMSVNTVRRPDVVLSFCVSPHPFERVRRNLDNLARTAFSVIFIWRAAK
jgi:hypothetical protein